MSLVLNNFIKNRHASFMRHFYPRDAILAQVLAMALCLSVCLSVCLSQVGVLLKWLDGSSWILARRLLSTSPTLRFKEIQVCTK